MDLGGACVPAVTGKIPVVITMIMTQNQHVIRVAGRFSHGLAPKGINEQPRAVGNLLA